MNVHLPQNPEETFSAKRLLTPVSMEEADFFAADYNMNLYRGCNHGCIYCDTRSECYHIEDFDRIRYKENCLLMLERELRQKKRPGIVSMGAASDPYNALETRLCLTQQALTLLGRYHFGATVTTKGALIVRDADLYARISRSVPVRVAFSITTTDDDLSTLIEPGASPSSERFAALKVLSKAGVFAGVWICPTLPFMTDSPETLQALLQTTADCGGRYVMCHFGMTLRTGNREYFYQALDKEPRLQGIKQRYADAFGLSYMCPSPNAEALYSLYVSEAKRLGLLYRFEDINRAMGEGLPRQIAMF